MTFRLHKQLKDGWILDGLVKFFHSEIVPMHYSAAKICGLVSPVFTTTRIRMFAIQIRLRILSAC